MKIIRKGGDLINKKSRTRTLILFIFDQIIVELNYVEKNKVDKTPLTADLTGHDHLPPFCQFCFDAIPC